VNQQVQFLDSTQGTPTSWSWDFGDAATSTSKNPTHTYSQAGTYNVKLIASDGTNSSTKNKSLTVSNSSKKVITTATCALSDVQAVVEQAKAGDIVLVPEGKAVWGSKLVIRKGITLKGAGIDRTVIVNGYDGKDDYDACLIMYRPDDFEANQGFRITGFTFDLNNKSEGIMLAHHKDPSLRPQTKIRIDHNRFINAMASNPSHQAIINNGMRGVVDNNIFEDCIYPIRNQWGYGDGRLWWDNWEEWGLLVYGAADNNMYYEDNIFSNCTIVMDSQYANRYVFRYNTVYHKAESYVSTLDLHGNQGGQMYSSFGGEVYGNLIFLSYGNGAGVRVLDHRGGKFLCFMNTVVQSSGSFYAYINVRDEYPDSDNPTVNPSPQFPNDSYYFLNRNNYTGGYWAVEEYQHSDNPPYYECPLIDRDYFVGTDGFNGTTGVGYGPLSARPTPQKAGVGYWATDQKIADLKNMVGNNPATPISGTLYKCTSPGIWTAYYQPYTYPHPLRTILND
jgi:PKD repeat protein